MGNAFSGTSVQVAFLAHLALSAALGREVKAVRPPLLTKHLGEHASWSFSHLNPFVVESDQDCEAEPDICFDNRGLVQLTVS